MYGQWYITIEHVRDGSSSQYMYGQWYITIEHVRDGSSSQYMYGQWYITIVSCTGWKFRFKGSGCHYNSI
jgi:hypothetical protein